MTGDEPERILQERPPSMAHLAGRRVRVLGKTEVVRAASEALAQLPPEKFRRTR
jgi:hypothetical protein